MIDDKYTYNGMTFTVYAINGSNIEFVTDNPTAPFYTMDIRLVKILCVKL